MFRAVIFDIDGVIVDSEPLHWQAFLYALKKVKGIDVTIDGGKFIGLSLANTIKKFGLDSDSAEMVKALSTEYYLSNINEGLLRPDIREVWQRLTARDTKMGCVSSAEMRICQKNVATLGSNYLQHIPIVAFESVEITKPHPMPYLKMLDILQVSSHEVIVIEDSDTGIRSASEAGITHIYAWPHSLSSSQSYSKAKQVIKSLRDIEFIADLWKEVLV